MKRMTWFRAVMACVTGCFAAVVTVPNPAPPVLVPVPCVSEGCKPDVNKASDMSGGANGCGISATVSIGDAGSLVGACGCNPTCKSVEGAQCQAKGTFTVIVSAPPGTNYVFCSNEIWATTSNTATITLDSGLIACNSSGASSAENWAHLFVQCGTQCGNLTTGQSAWYVSVRVKCYACKWYAC